MTVKYGYNNYKKSPSWISRLSICARGILSGTEQNHDQISVLLAPEMPPSPESSGITSMMASDCNSHSAFVSPSPSSSSSSLATLLSVEKGSLKPQNDKEQHEPNLQHEYSQPSLTSNNYFTNRPLPTQRRSPGRNRHSSNKDSKSPRTSFLSNDCDAEGCTATLDSLVQKTLTYFVDTSSLPVSSTSLADLHSKGTHHTTELVERLKSKLMSPTPVHPSLLKLANDLLAYMNETQSLTNELQQLKPKLEACLLIHGKAVA